MGTHICQRLDGKDEILEGNVKLLKSVLERLAYLSNWTFGVITVPLGYGDVFVIQIETTDSTRTPPEDLLVSHKFEIPCSVMGTEDVERWILERILLVHQHEACEYLKIGGEAIFYPDHGHGKDPYKIERRM